MINKIGWKKTALIFMILHFISCLLYFAVRDVNLLILVRFIYGIGFGASANAIVTIASQILPKLHAWNNNNCRSWSFN